MMGFFKPFVSHPVTTASIKALTCFGLLDLRAKNTGHSLCGQSLTHIRHHIDPIFIVIKFKPLITIKGYDKQNCMNKKENLDKFSMRNIKSVNNSVAIAEEMVSNYYKMSSSQWLHSKYDVKTLADLRDEEIVFGPFAQIIRYEGHKTNKALGSDNYDFYKICLQDHSILSALNTKTNLLLFPFTVYIVVHELIHIVRFSKFLQSFNASAEEKHEEERRVHDISHQILKSVQIQEMPPVLQFFHKWRTSAGRLKKS